MRTSIIRLFLIGLSSLLIVSCSIPQMVEYFSPDRKKEYYAEVQAKIDSLYKENLRKAFRAPLDESIKKELNEKRVWRGRYHLDVSRNGELEESHSEQSSGFKLLDHTIEETLKSVKALPPPPVEILENGKTEMRWDFVLRAN